MDAPLGRSVALCTRAEAAKRDAALALTLIYFYGRIAGRGGPEDEEEGSQSVVDYTWSTLGRDFVAQFHPTRGIPLMWMGYCDAIASSSCYVVLLA